jgi:hypothetical protein
MGRQVDEQAIRMRAYELWMARGCVDGYEEQDWLQAERELLDEQSPEATPSPTRAVDESVQQSFPASDPPASRLPDEPPVNADEKWAAAAQAAERGDADDLHPFANPLENAVTGATGVGKVEPAIAAKPDPTQSPARPRPPNNGSKRKFSNKH